MRGGRANSGHAVSVCLQVNHLTALVITRTFSSADWIKGSKFVPEIIWGLVTMQMLSEWVWGGARDSAWLSNKYMVMPVLLVPGRYFE